MIDTLEMIDFGVHLELRMGMGIILKCAVNILYIDGAIILYLQADRMLFCNTVPAMSILGKLTLQTIRLRRHPRSPTQCLRTLSE